MGTMKWQPAWWNDGHATAWERVKEAMRRDWEQTRHDFKIAGGHQLNQKISDTVKQAAGDEVIPADDRPNPPKVIGNWDDVELPTEYGYGARSHYQAHTAWNDEIEGVLRTEWASSQEPSRRWEDVRDHVRRGFEAKR